MAERRFNDEEVSLILRRAVEGGGADASGLTLSQLKEIAAEVGLDPTRVEAAALSVQAERMGGAAHRSGRGVTARYDLDVAGDMSPDRRADVLRSVRQVMGRHGIVTEGEGSLEWKARDYFGGRYVTVRSRDGRTHIEAMGNFRDGAMVTGSAGFTFGLVGAALAVKATVGGIGALGLLGPVVLIAGAAAGAALPAWALYRYTFRREDAALRTAVAEIAARVQTDEGGAPRPGQAASLDARDPARGLLSEGSSPGGDEPLPR